YITGATKVGTKAINNLGNVRFDNVKAYDATKPQKYHYYAAVETKTPKGFVVAKARPLVFVNPFTNPDGTGYLDTTYLYPKNNTQKLEFNLTKYAIYNEADGKYSADGAKELAGAKFQLYRGQPGSGTKVGDVLTTDKNGKVTANN
ncbi:pilin N-terminal domain-containing protein, partial [Ligilactobacillus agilis]